MSQGQYSSTKNKLDRANEIYIEMSWFYYIKVLVADELIKLKLMIGVVSTMTPLIVDAGTECFRLSNGIDFTTREYFQNIAG